MWYRYLRNCISLWLLLGPLAAVAQAPLCDDKAAIDSAVSYISQHYSYTSQGWQDACDSLLFICPDLDRLWQMKAMPAIKTGDWHGCFSSLAHAVWLNPGRWLPYQAFLKCLFVKDYVGALNDFRKSDSLFPGSGVMDHSFDFYRGLCYLGLNDFGHAYVFLKRDIENQEKYRGKDNVHFVSLFYWGLCHYLNDGYKEAEDAFGRCLKIFPQYPEPSYYLGLTLRKMGRDAKALRCFRTAREYLLAGYHSNEDQEFYINYPYAIALREVDEQLSSGRR